MQQYSNSNTFLFPSTLLSMVETKGPRLWNSWHATKLFQCQYFPFPLHTAFHSGNPRAPVCGSDGMPQYSNTNTYVVVAFPSALFRIYVHTCMCEILISIRDMHGEVPHHFRMVAFPFAVFRSIPHAHLVPISSLCVYPISSVFSSIARKMHRFADRVPVRTEGSGTRYDGRVWYELLSCKSSVNGKPVDRSRALERSVLYQGDQVTMEYQNKTYHGVVDMLSHSESEGQESHSISPLHMPLSPEMRAGTHLSCEPEPPRLDEWQESLPHAELDQLTPKIDERRSPRKRIAAKETKDNAAEEKTVSKKMVAKKAGQ